MKTIYLLLVTILFCACSSLKAIENQLVGKTKQNLMQTWGSPIRVFDNTTDGEILVYADQVYDESNRNNSRKAGSNYWKYTYIYIY